MTSLDEDLLYSTAFEANILAAISSHLALFPCRDPKLDENYPPAMTQVPMGAKRYPSNSTISSENSTAESTPTGRNIFKSNVCWYKYHTFRKEHDNMISKFASPAGLFFSN